MGDDLLENEVKEEVVAEDQLEKELEEELEEELEILKKNEEDVTGNANRPSPVISRTP